ncbi:MAG TPA: hypothetical protein VIM69_09950, partial [Opitutaceae bacterium]
MRLRIRFIQSDWWLALIATNLAVIMAMFVMFAAGKIGALQDLASDLAQGLIFGNFTSALAMLILRGPLEKLARDHRRVLPYAIGGIALVILLGLFARQIALVAFHQAPAKQFWADYT